MAKIDWKNHIVELVVVFLGVTLAFLLDNYRENRRSAESEQRYLTALHKDISADIQQLQDLIEYTKTNLEQVVKLDRMLQRENVNMDSLDSYTASMASLDRFTPQQIPYQSLTASGDWAVLSSFELKQQLSKLYSFYDVVKRKDEVYVEYVNEYVLPFFLKKFDLHGSRMVKREAIRGHRFSNLVQGFIVSANQKLAGYRECLEKCQAVLTILPQEPI